MYGFLLCALLCIIIILLHYIPKSAFESQGKKLFVLINLNNDESAEMQIRSAVDMCRRMDNKTGGIIAVDTGLSDEGRNICKAFCSEIGGLYLVNCEELSTFLERNSKPIKQSE